MKHQIKISLIAAVAANGVIGRRNRLPWDIPEDLKHFRAITLGHTVLMGRRTYESIGRPLGGRKNIIISGTKGFAVEGATVMPSLNAALDCCSHSCTSCSDGEIFIIGGAKLFTEALPLADKIYLTMIHKEFEGDTYFPNWPRHEFTLTMHEDHEGNIPFSFLVFERLVPQKNQLAN